jgi:hypothetical protein
MDRLSCPDKPGPMHPDLRGATGAVEPDPHQAANLIIKHLEGNRRAFLLSAG